MIPLAEARRWVMEQVAVLPATAAGLGDAAGCVLAEAVVALEPVPPFVNSAMDGYALRAKDVTDTPASLDVVGTVLAGDDPRFTLGAGQAARIMTGAPLPAGADAVCMVERTRTGETSGTVVIEVPVAAGDNVRHPGDDIGAGDLVFDAGTPLGAAHLGVLSSLGLSEVAVHRRPRVAVLSTGDELFGGQAPLPPGKIRDSNRPALVAALTADGFAVRDLGVVGDDESAVARSLADAARSCDAVVTSGGVSVGDRDVVRLALDAMGSSTRWMQVAIRPAKPLAAGRIGEPGTPFFGLPGNPVSALVSYELFVRPALRAMGGHLVVDRPLLRAIAGEPIRRRADGKLHLLRARLSVRSDGQLVAVLAGGQASHQLRAMAEATALALVPDGTGVDTGEPVAVLVLDGDRIPADGGTPLGLEPGW